MSTLYAMSVLPMSLSNHRLALLWEKPSSTVCYSLTCLTAAMLTRRHSAERIPPQPLHRNLPKFNQLCLSRPTYSPNFMNQTTNNRFTATVQVNLTTPLGLQANIFGWHLQLRTGEFCWNKVYSPHAFGDSNQCTQIREKTLEFSAVLPYTALQKSTHNLLSYLANRQTDKDSENTTPTKSDRGKMCMCKRHENKFVSS